jgi:ketosteroid isomerase-like protein
MLARWRVFHLSLRGDTKRRNIMDDRQIAEQLAALQERVRVLEDQVAIHRLINSWGPAVDTGNSEAAAALFSHDAILESDLSYLTGPAAIAAMVLGDGHQSLIRGGSAHIPAFPVVDVHGDTASATGYTRVYRHTDEGYDVWRVSANHWEFRREPDGWRVTRRTNHVINGGPEASRILAGLFDEQT